MTDLANVRDADFVFLQALLKNETGFLLEDDRQYLVETRLTPVVSRHGLSSISELVARVRDVRPSDPLHRTVVEALVNGETTFFRDLPCFDGFVRVVLPQLIERQRDTQTLRVWSAACSTGQEPYSISMLLADKFPALASWDVRIVASDVSAAHLERARAGRYSQFEVNRGLPARLLVENFEQHDGDWVIGSKARRGVEFIEVNLIRDWPVLPMMDVVFLRNVMIYWNNATKRRVLERVRQILRPGGYLLLGAAETTYYLDEHFERFSDEAPCCFRLAA